MRFKEFLIEAPTQKPRYRLGPDGQYVRTTAPRTRPSLNIPTPTYPQQEPISNLEKTSVDFDPSKLGKVAKPRQRFRAGEEPQPRVRKPRVKPKPTPAPLPPLVNPPDPLDAGPLEPPVPVPPLVNPPGPLGAGPLEPPQQGKPKRSPEIPTPLTLEPLGQGPLQTEPGHEETPMQRILAIANNAAANGNKDIINQLLRMAGEARQAGNNFSQSNANGYLFPKKPRIRRSPQQRAQMAARQMQTSMTPVEQKTFLSTLAHKLGAGSLQ